MSTSASSSGGDSPPLDSIEMHHDGKEDSLDTSVILPDVALKQSSTNAPIMTEKKRDREKKRRTDITNAIDALVKLLVKIDPSLIMVRNNQVFGILSSTGSLLPMNEHGLLQTPPTQGDFNESDVIKDTANFIGMKRRYRTSLIGDPVPLNRTDIIHHAAKVLEKVYRENEELKKEVQQLKLMIAQQTAASNPLFIPPWPLFPYWNPQTQNNTLADDGSNLTDYTIDPITTFASSLPQNLSSSSLTNVAPSGPVFDLQQQLLRAQQQYQLQSLYQQQLLLYQQQQQQQQPQQQQNNNLTEESNVQPGNSVHNL